MKDLVKNPIVLVAGTAILTFLTVRYIMKRKEMNSSFDGDGVHNFEPTSSYDAFEPSSNACGCGM